MTQISAIVTLPVDTRGTGSRCEPEISGLRARLRRIGVVKVSLWYS